MEASKQGNNVYSVSDLIAYSGCLHATWMDYRVLTHQEDPANPEKDPFLDLLAKKGNEHELNYLASLKEEGLSVVEIPQGKSNEEQIGLTLEAMRSGVDVVYQAVLFDDPWIGHPDFLVKCDLISDLGPFSYEIFDTKLAKFPKPEHIVQISAYSHLLEKAQGLAPRFMHIITGDNQQHDFPVSRFLFYYRHLKQRFESYLAEIPEQSYPDPCDHCAVCHWKTTCADRWESDDHLSLIANIRRDQREKLNAAGISSVAQFAAVAPEYPVKDLNMRTQENLHAQAVLQNHKRITHEDKWEYMPFEPGTGRAFERLPFPAEGDLFFDIEGDPLYPDGLEYLFGVYEKSGEFHSWWAHDHGEEKIAVDQLMAFFTAHISKYPKAHIYHYNTYEITAIKRLTSRYAIHEETRDNFLRNCTFVDLYKVAREGVRTSEPGIGLKNFEVFYMGRRDDVVSSADASVVFYDLWRETGEQKLLDDIENYNKIDCESTYLLRNWLIELKPEDTGWFECKNATEEENERKPWEIEYENMVKQLYENVDYEMAEKIAHLLEYHRRERNVELWEAFERDDKTFDELIEDPECIADLQMIADPVEEKRSLLYTYKFPPQEFKLRQHDRVSIIGAGTYPEFKEIYTNGKDLFVPAGTIFSIDEAKRVIRLKYKPDKYAPPLPPSLSIGPRGIPTTNEIRKALYDFAQSVVNGDGKFQALLDVLNRSVPKVNDHKPGDSLVRPKEMLKDTKDVIANLDDSYMSIQGPPGTGKTYVSARVIVSLLQQGKKVGITSNSHNAIHNLIEAIEDAATEARYSLTGVKKSNEDGAGKYYKDPRDPEFSEEIPGEEARKELLSSGLKEVKIKVVIEEPEVESGLIDDTYGGNVIVLDDGRRLSFAGGGLIDRPRVWDPRLGPEFELYEGADRADAIEYIARYTHGFSYAHLEFLMEQALDEKEKTFRSSLIVNMDKGSEVPRLIDPDVDDRYGTNVIVLSDGGRLSFSADCVTLRPRAWLLGENKESDEGAALRRGRKGGSKGSGPGLEQTLLYAGTAWLFVRSGFRKNLDYLFVDEAGQVSLANLIAMGTSAKNIVLVGDQMQLSEPVQAVHPGESGLSALDYLLKGYATIPDHLGIFLNVTYRMHPAICTFISNAFYEGKLIHNQITEARSLSRQSPISGGIYMIDQNHTGCTQRSAEEGAVVEEWFHNFLQCVFSTNETSGTMSENDILVVTPYNVQVNYLSRLLSNYLSRLQKIPFNALVRNARVGTVDKFQGQEAPVVLISMVTSTEKDIPRFMEFLYSGNRLNVALSRAQCVSVIVMNTKLLDFKAKTVAQMGLLNTFCWLEEYAEHPQLPHEIFEAQ